MTPTQTHKKPALLLSIQSLRGIAALLVVLMHTSGVRREGVAANVPDDIAFLTHIWDQGFAGVDMFFVISGFVMVYVTQNSGQSLRGSARFLWARACRIYPLWWVFVSLMMLYFLVSYGQITAPNNGTTSADIIPHALKSFFLIPQSVHPVLAVGWTLVHEMAFYFIFAGLLLLPRKWIAPALIVWAVLIGLSSAAALAPKHALDYPSLILSPLNLEFILGAIMCFLFLSGKAKGGKAALIIGAGLFCAALIIGIDKARPHLVYSRVWMYGVPSAILLYGAAVQERAGRLTPPSWLTHLGNWSYSLYLSHMFILLALRRVLQMGDSVLPPALKFQAAGPWDDLLFAVIAIPAAIIFSAISFRWIEQPLLRMTRR